MAPSGGAIAKFAINESGTMSPESISGSVVPLAMFLGKFMTKFYDSKHLQQICLDQNER